MSVPTIRNVRWRYCARYDELPAAKLGQSLLRLGIAKPSDWTGSAVDFVERGFQRFCKDNGIEAARRVWEGDLQIMDQLFDMTEIQRGQARAEMGDESAQLLFLVGVFTSAASVPLAPSLAILEQEHRLLPAAFHATLRHSLWKWMYVYDYEAAAHHAEMGLIDSDESEAADSIYTQVAATIPECLRNRLEVNPHSSLARLRALQPSLRGTQARELVSQLLELTSHCLGYRHAWPGRLTKQVPGLEDYLDECDGIGPGCLLNWYEYDAMNACFDEEMTYVGQNGPLEPSILRVIDIGRSECARDKQVRQLFEYISALVHSLASAAKLIETIRDINDEHLRQHRLKSGVPAEPSASGVRDE